MVYSPNVILLNYSLNVIIIFILLHDVQMSAVCPNGQVRMS